AQLVDNIDTNVGGVGGNISTIMENTRPEQITKDVADVAERGVLSEILTRSTGIAPGDSIAIRYRTQTGLTSVPTLSVYDMAGGVSMSAAPMSEIASGTGIYESNINTTGWAEGDYTVVCKATVPSGAMPGGSINATDSMVLSVGTGGGSGDGSGSGTVTDLGPMVTDIRDRIGAMADALNALNLGDIGPDAKNARISAQKAVEDIAVVDEKVTDIQSKTKMMNDLSAQLQELQDSLSNMEKTQGGGGGTTVISSTTTTTQTGPTIITSGGGGEDTAPAKEEKKAETVGAAVPAVPSAPQMTTRGLAKSRELRAVSNKVEELTALTKIVTKIIESNNNKPVVVGWFERE
ncbi:MAG: hypothetical protein PHN63_07180, partial [Candidatus Omnitrophica bacterium]|nr:hypothetical protein [Candidatus Omnitrophota bacterium]